MARDLLLRSAWPFRPFRQSDCYRRFYRHDSKSNFFQILLELQNLIQKMSPSFGYILNMAAADVFMLLPGFDFIENELVSLLGWAKFLKPFGVTFFRVSQSQASEPPGQQNPLHFQPPRAFKIFYSFEFYWKTGERPFRKYDHFSSFWRKLRFWNLKPWLLHLGSVL